MRKENVLIVYHDLRFAQTLKEYVLALGLTKIFLSTTVEVLRDLPDDKFFDYLFLDVPTVAAAARFWRRPPTWAASARVVLMDWSEDPRVRVLSRCFPVCVFVRKPHVLGVVGEVMEAHHG